jgi:uncharacterized protein YqjF (DUF2071 family)
MSLWSRLGRLHMGWRNVLFANWPVEPSVVGPHLPDALTLDSYEGQAWLSVVPFTNVDVRPAWAPDGFGVPLPELNLRTYVTRDGTPGVYFFSLDADGIAGVLGARLVHHLPYYYADIDLSVTDGRVVFESERRHPGTRPLRFAATYGPTGERFRAEPGTLAAFLAERYRYYTETPGGALRYATIEHDPWPLYRAAVTLAENNTFAANGFAVPDADPVHYYSPGVDTTASTSRRL